jgi:hypothetical protein
MFSLPILNKYSAARFPRSSKSIVKSFQYIMTKRRIAILFHERHRGCQLAYHIMNYAESWRADGHEVIELFGVGQFIPADLIFVHVDLSVVPDEYIDFANQYPIVVNGRVRDIRKSTFSSIKLGLNDSYRGMVILKSNLNYAGRPEINVGINITSLDHGIIFRSPMDYKIFESMDEVPPLVFADTGMIVERFLPEFSGFRFVMRAMQFLGNRIDCMRIVSDNPIVNGASGTLAGLVEPDPEIVEARERMNFDYGKFDYAINDGKAILFDTNKTPGAALPGAPAEILASRKNRANGIYDYF